MSRPDLVSVARGLREGTATLAFAPPVAFVYRPLEYAWAAHRRFLDEYARGGVEALLLGMNPGPFGMAQTGVPFGDVGMVRDWLRIEARVDAPAATHPKRPVLGFDTRRGEVSGRRLWGWARQRHGTPERFFARFFVWNYCPLALVEASSRNRTPDKLPAAERGPLFAACDRALVAVVERLAPRVVIGIGRFAEQRAATALAASGVAAAFAPHPSPASPLANRGWVPAFEAALREAGTPIDDHRAP